MSIGKILLIILGIFLVITIIAVLMALKKIKAMENYKEIYKGMPLKELLKLMGNDYSKESLPKFDRYTWSIDSKYWKGVKRVVVQVKDEEVILVNHFMN